MNVSYIKFDKTKPYPTKQIGDGLPNTSAKSNKPQPKINLSGKNQTKNILQSSDAQQESKQSSVKAKRADSEISVVTEKTKSKRQSKVLEAEQKQPEINLRQTKKHKKDS